MIHVTAGESARLTLQRGFELKSIPFTEIISLTDDLRVGPLSGMEPDDDFENRREWWRSILEGGDGALYAECVYDDLTKMKRIKKLMAGDNPVCIWYGSCLLDQLMKARLLDFLKPALEKVFIVPISCHMLISTRIRMFPSQLGVLKPEHIEEFNYLLRPVSQIEVNDATAFWQRVESDNATLRVVSGSGMELHNDHDYFDSFLISNCKNEYQSSARVIGETLVDTNFAVSDFFLNWRLKELVRNNTLVARGVLRNMRDYEVRAI